MHVLAGIDTAGTSRKCRVGECGWRWLFRGTGGATAINTSVYKHTDTGGA